MFDRFGRFGGQFGQMFLGGCGIVGRFLGSLRGHVLLVVRRIWAGCLDGVRENRGGKKQLKTDIRMEQLSEPIFFTFLYRTIQFVWKRPRASHQLLLKNWSICPARGEIEDKQNVYSLNITWGRPLLPRPTPDVGKKVKMMEIHARTAKNRRLAGNS